MWSLWKEVLLPGTQFDKGGRRFTIRRSDVLRAHANARRMLARGFPVPCVWEHLNVEAGDPEEWKARYAKHTFAHVGAARVNARGALELRHDGVDDRDRDQLLKTKFCSPKLYAGYSDPRGGRYRGTTVAHVAATPTPVQFWQKPFELSRPGALYLSYTPGGDAVADDADKGADKVDETSDAGRGGAAGELKELIDALREKGLTISDKVTSLKELVIAVESSGPAGDGGDEDDLPEPEEPGEPEPGAGGGGAADTTAAGQAPLLMSATDPKVLAWAKNDRKDLERRVKQLFASGRIDRPLALELLRKASAVELSYTKAGDLTACPLAIQVEGYERLRRGTTWKRTGREALDLSATLGVDPPEGLATAADKEAASVLRKQEELAARLSVGAPAPK